jgi:serralysin
MAGINGSGQLQGTSGNDQITGSGGRDTLAGGGGVDTLRGGAGDDTYQVPDGNSVIIEEVNGGIDTIAINEYLPVFGETGPVTPPSKTYTIPDNVENLNVYTNAPMTTINGNASANTISGNYSGPNAIYGFGGNDQLMGSSGEDYLNGGDGNDTLNGGTGEITNVDGVQNDTLVGGAGDDVYMNVVSADDVIEEENGGTDTIITGSYQYTLGMNVENLRYDMMGGENFTGIGNELDNSIAGGFKNDTLIGSEGNDTLEGGGGADMLDGGIGDDRLVADNMMSMPGGEVSVDTLEGGEGNDTYVVGESDIIIEAEGQGTDTVELQGSYATGPDQAPIVYQLSDNLENLTYVGSRAFHGMGNGLNNVISVDADYYTATTLDGGEGADTLIGGKGSDTYIVDNVGDVVEDKGTDSWRPDTVKTSLDLYTLSAGVERLVFTGQGSFHGVGNSGDNMITGGSDNDTLDGGSGFDILIGGKGDDIYRAGTYGTVVEEEDGGIDTFILTGNDEEGMDYVYGDLTSNGSYSGEFYYSYDMAHVENLFYEGSSDFVAYGNAADNEIRGGSGNDTLEGGFGADTLVGGAGNDTYMISTDAEKAATDEIVELAGGGIDTVTINDQTGFAVAYTLAENVENLSYNGFGDFIGSGNASDNVITGGAGNNTINGGAGNDTVVFYGERGDYTATKNGDGSVTLSGWQDNTVTGVERFKFFDTVLSFDQLFSEPLPPVIEPPVVQPPVVQPPVDQPPVDQPPPPPPPQEPNLSGNNGSNVINGDDLLNNVIKGLGGNDKVHGYGGNDKLYGDSGNDYLYGGAGNDQLWGGSGKDSFVFDYKPNAKTNKDVIKDFRVKDDTIRLDNKVFTKIGKDGTLKAGAFWTNNTGKAHDKDDRVIYDKNSGVLYYDADGSGKGAGVAFATISKNLSLTNKDFYVL